MGKKGSGKRKEKAEHESLIHWIDPSRIRFQHSKIRPVFSGCGRRLEDTLNQIREGKLRPQDLPPIQVLAGQGTGEQDTESSWYFSLNNRRLWVLKRCREEGLLDDNKIPVRIREAKSKAELERYTLQNCSLEAKIMKEKPSKDPTTQNSQDLLPPSSVIPEKYSPTTSQNSPKSCSHDDSDSESEDSDAGAGMNPFSVLL